MSKVFLKVDIKHIILYNNSDEGTYPNVGTRVLVGTL